MRIKITAQHIINGVRGGHKNCPIALALIDAGIAPDVYCAASLDKGGRYCGPKSLNTFIKAFDAGRPVKPFSFILRKYRGRPYK